MKITKRAFIQICAAGTLTAMTPNMVLAADIKAMAEALVNLTIRQPNGPDMDFSVPRKILEQGAEMAPEKRGMIYAQNLNKAASEKLGKIGPDNNDILGKALAKSRGEDRLTENVSLYFGDEKFEAELRVKYHKK